MKWINVKDELPSNYQTVLTYGSPNYGGYHIRQCSYSDGIFRFSDSEREHKGIITHWMPLPKPPKK
jgi:hypothetical protein